MTVAAASPGITVAGRTFRPVTTYRFPQYNWVTSHLWAVNTDGVETLQQLAAQVAETGAAGAILAGLYVEVVDGQPLAWSAESAKKVRALFDGLADFEEMGRLQSELVVALPRFFPGVVRSWPTFETSSESSDTTPPSISEVSRNAEDPPTTSESSAASSAA